MILIFLFTFYLAFVKSESELRCVIYNEKYQEFLYAANKLFPGSLINLFKRSIYTFPVGVRYSFKHGKNLVYTEYDRKGVWIFEPVPNKINVYYLKNLRYKDEYFFAGDKKPALLISSNSRYVHTRKEDNLDESFMWRFDKLNDDDTYNIYNIKYNEPLYAAINFELRRDVYTWFRITDGMEFKWIIKCKDDQSIDTELNL